MSYITETLLKDEQVVFSDHPHYIIFYTVVLWLALALFMLTVMHSIFLALFMLLAGALSFVGDLVSYYYSEYVITNRRILVKIGFIRRKAFEIYLERIEGVLVNQGIIGRIFNFGTVIIAGVGGSKDPFYFIPDPLRFRNMVQQQMDVQAEKSASKNLGGK